MLDLTAAVDQIAGAVMASGLLPLRAVRDAAHIAVAAVHGVDVLLTWNCRHIANGAIMRELRSVVAEQGFELPTLCTPEELLGD